MKGDKKDDEFVDMRDKMDELIELLCTDRTLFSVCKSLILGEAVWLEEEEQAQRLFPYVFRLFSKHLQDLCKVWRSLEGLL